MSNKSPATVQITECLEGSGATVDAEQGIIRGVKLVGLESKNPIPVGRSYPAHVLREAVPHYEGLKVNIDHPSQPSDPRGVRDRIGMIQGARFIEGKGIYGDFKYNPKHQLAEQIAWEAVNNPKALGFSHNVRFKWRTQPGGKQVVESILAVRSLDLVADPATTNGFFESIEPETDMDFSKLTLESLQAERPDLLKSVLESQQATEAAKADKDALESLRKEVETLKAEKAAAALEAEIAQEIEAAGLTKEQCSDVFMEQVRHAKDATGRKALIDDRKALVGNVTEGKAKPEGQKPKTTSTSAMEGVIPSEPEKLSKWLLAR